jgi:metallo-beta-lactamase family protein
MAYLQFLGAAGTVTGSKHLINTSPDGAARGGMQVLLDCGMFQGHKEWRERNWQPLPIPASAIDAVILTHAHIDHAGWIPRLVKEGFRGQIYCTPATKDLCGVLLPDSGHLQEEDAAFANKRRSSKHAPALPLYTMEEAEAALPQLHPVGFFKEQRLGPELSFKFLRAAHILGSAMVELKLTLNGATRTVLFTGDIGRVQTDDHAPGKVVSGQPDVEATDILIMESTYGARKHPTNDVRPQMAELITRTVEHGGSVVVPAFAVERTQKFLFLLKELMEDGRVPHVPVYADSPMAIKAVEIFLKHKEEYSERARSLIQRFGSPLDWPGFHFASRVEESKRINELRYPAVIVSANGMASGGRILHHLLLKLPDPRNLVLFIGFQAPGTRGAIIKSGAPTVKIFGDVIPIRARIAALEQFSDHADTPELLRWLRTFDRPPQTTFLVHGEPPASSAMRDAIVNEMKWRSVHVAEYLQKVDLSVFHAGSAG